MTLNSWNLSLTKGGNAQWNSYTWTPGKENKSLKTEWGNGTLFPIQMKSWIMSNKILVILNGSLWRSPPTVWTFSDPTAVWWSLFNWNYLVKVRERSRCWKCVGLSKKWGLMTPLHELTETSFRFCGRNHIVTLLLSSPLRQRNHRLFFWRGQSWKMLRFSCYFWCSTTFCHKDKNTVFSWHNIITAASKASAPDWKCVESYTNKNSI